MKNASRSSDQARSVRVAIEFVGFLSTSEFSEAVVDAGPVVQTDVLEHWARTHEEAGFDRVIVAYNSGLAGGFAVSQQVLSLTQRLGVVLAHRPGTWLPVPAAREFATADAFYPGRFALNIVTGAPEELRRDGNWTERPAGYERTDEFLTALELLFGSKGPVSFHGQHFGFEDAALPFGPAGGRIPIYFGGASPEAVVVGARHADVYMLWGESLAGIADRIGEIRAAAATSGREPQFSVSFRPIVAETETAAWTRARDILERVEERQGMASPGRSDEGSRRLLAAAAAANILDERLWTKLATTTRSGGNSIAPVGSYEQVADTLLEFVELGISTIHINGYLPIDDVRRYGQLIAAVRERASRRGEFSRPK